MSYPSNPSNSRLVRAVLAAHAELAPLLDPSVPRDLHPHERPESADAVQLELAHLKAAAEDYYGGPIEPEDFALAMVEAGLVCGDDGETWRGPIPGVPK